jgi:D-alanyl-D-alanine carboxypeptidase
MLDAPISAWFPTFPGATKITVRELMNHTSGIFNYTDDLGFQSTVNSQPMKKWTHQELVDIAAAQPPYFPPGTAWKYSNTDYIMLGMIVEAVTGDTIGKEIRASLLDPNHLGSTSFDGEEPIVGTLAHGWLGSMDVSTAIDPSYAWAAGAMVSSMSDLCDWAGTLYAGKILMPSTMKEMLTTVATDQPGLRYGLGVFVGDASIAGDTIVGHPGDIPGYHTHMWYLPNEHIAFATAVNADGTDPNDISAALLPYLLGK